MKISALIDEGELKSKIEELMKYNESCLTKFKNLNGGFWFQNKDNLKEFLNHQTAKRLYGSELKQSYFNYINEKNILKLEGDLR